MAGTPLAEIPAGLILPRLIVGLGNPGTKYDRTRHNIGFEVIDALAKSYPDVSLAENKRFQGIAGEFRSAGERTILLKPTTFMNILRTGRAGRLGLVQAGSCFSAGGL